MSRWSNGFLAIIAASMAFGAVHLEIASGSDLKTPLRGDAGLFGSRGIDHPQLASEEVNRAAKSDRLAGALAGSSGPTIVFKVAGLRNTSIATFRSLPQNSTQGAPVSRSILSTTACEPSVSALAEAARVVQSGRCVT
jgi:hypothetical protein